jgi:hypothetical protein
MKVKSQQMSEETEAGLFTRCHLCGNADKKMHGRSHVIPAWFFRQISSEAGDTLLLVDVGDFLSSSGTPKVPTPPVVDPSLGTPFDKTWYCIDCEKIFGKHDNFSAKFLKDPKNLGNGKARQRTLAPTKHRPVTILVYHMQAWKWRQFILSMVYRMHASNHEQYRQFDIGEMPAARIREILLKDKFDPDLFHFDVVTFATVRESSDTEHAFVSPAFVTVDGDTFTVYFAIWGLWLVVGYPAGSVSFASQLPEDSHNTTHFVPISTATSRNWFMQSIGIDAVKNPPIDIS